MFHIASKPLNNKHVCSNSYDSFSLLRKDKLSISLKGRSNAVCMVLFSVTGGKLMSLFSGHFIYCQMAHCFVIMFPRPKGQTIQNPFEILQASKKNLQNFQGSYFNALFYTHLLNPNLHFFEVQSLYSPNSTESDVPTFEVNGSRSIHILLNVNLFFHCL